MSAMSSRKGSALLIVLGMLAFMVISAVGLSAYLRSSRLPSSYLRRTSLSRQLAKAALAEAMQRIDGAIGNNPHPGVPDNANGNNWTNGVYVGSRLVSPTETVSTLTLEGLAYIPPPLVNEARRFSRLSSSAKWEKFSFDAGRFAFTAIDVSHCLDINRLKADSRRNFGNRKLTLSHVFEKHGASGSSSTGADKWDAFMEDFREDLAEDDEGGKQAITEEKIPLVSLADWNLAMGERKFGEVNSPFCQYLKSGDNFYGISSTDRSDARAETLRMMNFITDSYLPLDIVGETTEGEELLNLNTADGQPFQFSGSGHAKISDCIDAWQGEFKNELSVMDYCCLYDYLDRDHVPVSLAVPTVEQVPMIVGVKTDIKTSLKLVGSPVGDPRPAGEEENYRLQDFEYRLDIAQLGAELGKSTLRPTVVFPFKRVDLSGRNFSAEACVKLFLCTSADVRLRGGDLLAPVDGDFEQGATYADNGIITIGCPGAIDADFANKTREADVVMDCSPMRLNGIGSLQPKTLFTITRRYKSSDDPESGEIVAAHCNLPPLVADGESPLKMASEEFGDDKSFLAGFKNGTLPSVNLYAAAFIRVKEGADAVDQVPAGADGLSSGDPFARKVVGDACPILRFKADAADLFNIAAIDAEPKAMAFMPTNLICLDPRYNHAPENWMTCSDASKSTWLDAVHGVLGGGRDRDIFMFVSNREQLQSVYELAFLPRISGNFNNNASFMSGSCDIASDYRADYPSSIGDCLNGSLMWKTYNCYPRSGVTRDSFEGLGLIAGQGDYRLNPFAPTADGLMPAFANTPYDWSVASTNLAAEANIPETADSFNKSYAFSEANSKARFAWDDLREVAMELRNRLNSTAREHGGEGAQSIFEKAYDSLDWSGSSAGGEKEFCGVELSDKTDKLDEVDRKFLYGFWRECFAVKQQLFLIFVRAEPMMMGGGAVGQIPPQLSSRAVALVWRDPRWTNAPGNHRMRVLFYHQFD